MKHAAAPIWESASRPLFVRSTWLENTKRHFILDYEPRQRQPKVLKSSQSKGKESSRHSTSSEYSDLEAASSSFEHEDRLLVDSAKAKLHQPTTHPYSQTQQLQSQQQSTKVKQKRTKYFRRVSLYPRLLRYNKLPQDFYSSCSSLQDLQSNLSNSNHSNPDERLAERVLNWLDLAGKSLVFRGETNPSEDLAEMEGLQKKSSKQRSAKQITNPCNQKTISQNERRSSHCPKTSHKEIAPARKNSTNCSPPSQQKGPVKHITIMFKRDSITARNNPLGRKKDTSDNSTRFFSDNPVLANMYRRSLSYNNHRAAKPAPSAASGAFKNGRPRLHGADAKQKLTTPRANPCSASCVYDSKKQLHIFMPSLPKKSLLPASGEDTCSVLSSNFNELAL